MQRFALMISSVSLMLMSNTVPASADGPDVILGEIDGAVSKLIGEDVFIGFGTTSCNAGNLPLKWKSLPSNEHPVIGLNLYRYDADRFEQIGQSWLKHGRFALEMNACNLGCNPTNQGDALGPGCSDPYGETMNRGPKLGSRSDIDVAAGKYDGNSVKQKLDQITGNGWERSLQVSVNDLRTPGATYYVEGQYVTADDASAGNGLNNVSYRKLIVLEQSGQVIFAVQGDTIRMTPALAAWEGASLVNVDASEAGPENANVLSRVIVGSKCTEAGAGRFRYEYAVYNMNSTRGIQSISVPTPGAFVSGIGSSAPRSNGESWLNDPWTNKLSASSVVWSTQPHSTNSNANAIRWGTTYNFWFEADKPPETALASFNRFLPGEGGDTFEAQVCAPSH